MARVGVSRQAHTLSEGQNRCWVLAGSVLTLVVGLYLLMRSRLPRLWAALLAVVVLTFPPVLGFAVQIGRDAWFASFIVCGFGLAVRAARTSGHSRTLSLALPVTCGFLAGAARLNSPPAVLGLLCAVALLTLSQRWRGIWRLWESRRRNGVCW